MSFGTRGRWAVTVVLAAGLASAQEPLAPPKKPEAARPEPAKAGLPKVEFEQYQLPNGLRVILHVDRKLPIVHVNQWYHVGSKNERPGRTGFAHLFEHMMFQGSKNTKGEYFAYAEKAGANLQEGGVNGTTDNDRTNYFATVPSGNLENLLWLESDRLATLLDATDLVKLNGQRDVVKNERRQGLENTPYGRWFKLLVENLHPAGHPYSWTVIGSHEDLTAASLDDVKDFFRTWYTPNNLSLVIAGDFDAAEAKRLVAKYFGPLSAGPPLDRPTRFIPVLEGEKIIEATDRVPQDRVYMAWPGPEYFAQGDAELDLLARILTDGLSARLNKVLVYDKQLATAVNSFNNAGEISGAFVVIATARPGITLERIEGIVTDEVARLARTGPTLAELDRARTKQEFDFVTGLERIGGFGGKADLLNKYQTYLGHPGKFEADVARYRNLTVGDVQKAAARWLDTRNRLLIRFHPETGGRPDAQVVDRSQEPALGTDRPFQAPEVKEARLENGLQLFVVERRDLPKVAVTLSTRAGSAADPAGKGGTAHLTVQTIDMGTPTRQTLQIEDALGDLGTSLAGTAAREGSQVGFEVLKRNLGKALAVFADVVRHPTFPASEVDRERKRHLDGLSQTARNANAVAARVRAILAFGKDHPYGRPVQGLPGTVQGITREDLSAFHARHWKPSASALVFVGDITLAEATTLARTHFGGWTGAAPPPVEIPEPSPAPTGKVYLVDRQDAAQTVVTQFMLAPPRKTDDYFALQLADMVWGGGGFGTRLNLNLREEKGYSYGVFSSWVPYNHSGIWYAGGGVQTNKTKESLVEFDKELKALAGVRAITAEEFADARAKRVRGYSQQFESFSRIADQVAELWGHGLPMTELQRETEGISASTLEAARGAAAKYGKPGTARLLLVGDRAKIEAGVKELGLGEIVVLDAEGQPAP